LETVFEPFTSSAGRRTRTSGLGLAIARGIVEAHGGTIRAENRRGGGARFTLTLVQRRAPSASEAEVAR
ncbi:MAG: ATP-binding protein, partial [Dehalococcoidia bacterium]